MDEEQLLKLWEGLGYYNRARNLQKAAVEIMEQHEGKMPDDYEKLLSLPGIGSYTAGAVASISFQICQPAVDGNVLRIISRITENYNNILSPVMKKEITQIAMREANLSPKMASETFENFKKLTDEILKKSPDVTFYVQSVTPLVKNRGVLTNEKVNQYNARVSSYCRKQKWYFLDVASVFRNQNGALQVKYCSDPKKMGIHFSDEACAIWVKYLYTHTASDGVAVSVPERGRGR